MRKGSICNQIVKPKFPEQPRKLIYKKSNGNLVYLSPTTANDSMTNISVTCQKCPTSVTSDEYHQKFPMLSKLGAFNHGVART